MAERPLPLVLNLFSDKPVYCSHIFLNRATLTLTKVGAGHSPDVYHPYDDVDSEVVLFP